MPAPNPANVFYELVVTAEPWVDPEVAIEVQLENVTEVMDCTASTNPNTFTLEVWINTPLYPGEHGEFDWRAPGYIRPMMKDVQGLELDEIRALYHEAMLGDDIIPEQRLSEKVAENRRDKLKSGRL